MNPWQICLQPHNRHCHQRRTNNPSPPASNATSPVGVKTNLTQVKVDSQNTAFNLIVSFVGVAHVAVLLHSMKPRRFLNAYRCLRIIIIKICNINIWKNIPVNYSMKNCANAKILKKRHGVRFIMLAQ